MSIGDEVLCAWARERYGVAAVKVDFDLAEGWFGGSDVTPPDAWRVEVTITVEGGTEVTKWVGAYDVGPMVTEIAELGATLQRDEEMP